MTQTQTAPQPRTLRIWDMGQRRKGNKPAMERLLDTAGYLGK
jgi:hypothetical protein